MQVAFHIISYGRSAESRLGEWRGECIFSCRPTHPVRATMTNIPRTTAARSRRIASRFATASGCDSRPAGGTLGRRDRCLGASRRKHETATTDPDAGAGCTESVAARHEVLDVRLGSDSPRTRRLFSKVGTARELVAFLSTGGTCKRDGPEIERPFLARSMRASGSRFKSAAVRDFLNRVLLRRAAEGRIPGPGSRRAVFVLDPSSDSELWPIFRPPNNWPNALST